MTSRAYPEPTGWPEYWAVQSEHVRGEPRFYWIGGLTEEERRVADALDLDLGSARKATTTRRANRLAKALVSYSPTEGVSR